MSHHDARALAITLREQLRKNSTDFGCCLNNEEALTILTAALEQAKRETWEEAAKELDTRMNNCTVALSGRLTEHNLWFWEEREKHGWEANRTMLKHLADWCRQKGQEGSE